MSPTSLEERDVPFLDFASPTVAADPFDALRELTKQHWIARTPVGHVLLHHGDCVDVAKDRRFRTPDALGLAAQGVTSHAVIAWASSTLLAQNGDQHRRIRRLAQPAFTPHRAEQLRTFSAGLIRDIYDPFVPQGRAEVARLNDEYVVRTICRILGFPDSDWAMVAAWADAMNQVISVSVHEQIPRIEQAIGELDAYTEEQIDRLRRQPGDSLGSALVTAEAEGDRLSPGELTALFQTLLMAGAETTRNMLTLGLWVFARRPDQWATLADEPSLIQSAIEELLRYRPPFIGTARIASEAVQIHDLTIPAGTLLILGLPGANFDTNVFANSETFDVRRFVSNPTTPGHLSFGAGAHICLGAPLARVELQEAFGYLPRRLPHLRVDDEDPVGVQWTSPFGVHGPSRLPIAWGPALKRNGQDL
jgi:cytochrome P450